MPKINDDDANNPFASCHNGEREAVRGTLLVSLQSIVIVKGYGILLSKNQMFAAQKDHCQEHIIMFRFVGNWFYAMYIKFEVHLRMT